MDSYKQIYCGTWSHYDYVIVVEIFKVKQSTHRADNNLVAITFIAAAESNRRTIHENSSHWSPTNIDVPESKFVGSYNYGTQFMNNNNQIIFEVGVAPSWSEICAHLTTYSRDFHDDVKVMS